MAVTIVGSFLRLGLLTSFLFVLLSAYFEYNALSSYNKPILKGNMTEIEAIAKNRVKNAVTGEFVTFESLWETQPAVIVFFRRFGCGFCRVLAKQLSGIKPELDEKNVKLIGVGVEDLGKEEFIKGEFFNGELYIDEDMNSYKSLKYKRYGLLSMLPAMLTRTSLGAMIEVWKSGVSGDMQGDVYQVGGVLVISEGGEKVLLSHRQQSLADHVEINKILESLGIEPKRNIPQPEMPTECKIDGKGESACA